MGLNLQLRKYSKRNGGNRELGSMKVKKEKVLILLSIFLFPSLLYGHGGGLNSYGCHNQNSDHTYHRHQGDYSGQSFSSEQAFFDAISTTTAQFTAA